jgi:hypothetical protein
MTSISPAEIREMLQSKLVVSITAVSALCLISPKNKKHFWRECVTKREPSSERCCEDERTT